MQNAQRQQPKGTLSARKVQLQQLRTELCPI